MVKDDHHSGAGFSVAAHFADGLLNNSSGDGKRTESLKLVNPPRVVMAACLTSIGMHYLVCPFPLGVELELFPWRLGAAMVVGSGFLVGVRAVLSELTKHGTSPHHTEPTTTLVTTGPYSYSRNPA
jgi:protein-S-isoprenylcysteine O-methyltransferase Ste14